MSDRSSKDIEREIEQERSGLDETLSELTGRFDVDYVVRQIGTQLRDNGGEIGRTVQRAVKENPLALAVTGVGLGWLIFGQGRDPDAYSYGRDYEPDNRRHMSDGTAPLHSRADDPLHPAMRTEPDWARHDPDEFVTSDEFHDYPHDYPDDDHGPSAGDRAKGAMEGAKSGAQDRADRVRRGASARAAAMRARKDRVEARLSRGTEKMSDDARQRVIRARRRALEARDSAARGARRGADRAVDFFEEQPLVAGALALALGAALAGGLPRSRMEDRYLGEQSDALMDEAERIYREESEKLGAVARAAGDEARTVADEERRAADQNAPGEKTALGAAREEAENAAKRVKDRAEDEARRQDLGNQKT